MARYLAVIGVTGTRPRILAGCGAIDFHRAIQAGSHPAWAIAIIEITRMDGASEMKGTADCIVLTDALADCVVFECVNMCPPGTPTVLLDVQASGQ